MGNSYTYAKTTDLDDQISKLIDSAPDELNSFKELADALGNNPNLATDVLKGLNNKVDKEEGKGLSTNDFTNEEKEKLAGLGEFDDVELKLRDERLKYYGDPDIIPSDESYFTFKRNPITKITSISFKDVSATVDPSTIVIDKLVIPYKFNNFIVNRIDDGFNLQHYSIKEVIMPDSIEQVGDYFLYQSNVQKVKLSKNIKKVGTNFITYNFNLIDINLEDLKIESLPESGFTPNHFNKIIIPNSLKEIGPSCFTGTSGVEEIKILNNITKIREYSFNMCGNTFKKIYIPDSVQEIGEDCFTNNADDFTIYCNSGSVAERYAINNNLNYELLDNQSLILYPEISDAIVLYHKSDIRLKTVSNLSLSMPEIISDNYTCNLCLTTSLTQPSFVYSGEPIIWHGEDCDNEGHFVPESDKTYEISIKKLNMKKVIDESSGFVSTSTIYNPEDESNPYPADEALGIIITAGNYGGNSDVLTNLSQNRKAYYLKDGILYEMEVLELFTENEGMPYYAYVLVRYPDAPIGTTIYTIVYDEPVIVARVGEV